MKRTTDTQGHPVEEWFYGAGSVYFENGVVTKIENVIDGQDPASSIAALMYWETIADNLSKAGWSCGCVSTVGSRERTIFVADAHRDNGQRFVVRADEKLNAFAELESAMRAVSL